MQGRINDGSLQLAVGPTNSPEASPVSSGAGFKLAGRQQPTSSFVPLRPDNVLKSVLPINTGFANWSATKRPLGTSPNRPVSAAGMNSEKVTRTAGPARKPSDAQPAHINQ